MSAHHKSGTLSAGQKCEPGNELALVRAQRAKALVADLEAVLRKVGPCDLEDLRDRLCVASHVRFQAAVRYVIRQGLCKKEGKALRLIADDRVQLPRDMPAWYRARGVAA